MKDIAEQIVTVCAYLVNFQSPIVKKKQYNIQVLMNSFAKCIMIYATVTENVNIYWLM